MNRNYSPARCRFNNLCTQFSKMSLGILMILAGVSTGWFTRDLTAATERRELAVEAAQDLAERVELFERLLKEKDDRIILLASRVDATVVSIEEVSGTAKAAAENAEQAVRATSQILKQNPPARTTGPSAASLTRDRNALDEAVKEVNKQITKE